MTHHMTKPLAPVKRRLKLTQAESGPHRVSSRTQAERTDEEQPSQLLLCDFDHTLADFDTGDYKSGSSFTLHVGPSTFDLYSNIGLALTTTSTCLL